MHDFNIEFSNIRRILGVGGGNVLVNYPGSVLRIQYISLSKNSVYWEQDESQIV